MSLAGGANNGSSLSSQTQEVDRGKKKRNNRSSQSIRNNKAINKNINSSMNHVNWQPRKKLNETTKLYGNFHNCTPKQTNYKLTSSSSSYSTAIGMILLIMLIQILQASTIETTIKHSNNDFHPNYGIVMATTTRTTTKSNKTTSILGKYSNLSYIEIKLVA